MSTLSPYRKVLLVLISQVPSQRVLDSTCALCDRLGAGLEVVSLGNLLPEDLLAATAREITHSGLACEALAKPDWDIDDLVEWANTRTCVATVVLPAAECGPNNEAGESEDDRWRHLACPLVVAGQDAK